MVFPHVCSRIRENSDRITDRQNSHEFGYRLKFSVFCTLEALPRKGETFASIEDRIAICVALTGLWRIDDSAPQDITRALSRLVFSVS